METRARVLALVSGCARTSCLALAVPLGVLGLWLHPREWPCGSSAPTTPSGVSAPAVDFLNGGCTIVEVLCSGICVVAVCGAATFRSPAVKTTSALCHVAAFALSLVHLALALKLLSFYRTGVAAAGRSWGSADSEDSEDSDDSGEDCSNGGLLPQGIAVVQVVVLCIALAVSVGKNFELCAGLVSERYVRQAEEGRRQTEALVRVLLSQRCLPARPWPPRALEFAVAELAAMDSNNFPLNAGVGERESRIFCPLVAQRHYYMGHGIGRSGDLVAEQPKAAGSSAIYALTNALAADALRESGIRGLGACAVVPLATGMSIALVLLALRASRPAATHVVWTRVDQKSALKAIATCALVPVVVANALVGDEVRTDLAGVEAAVQRVGPEKVLCVLSTTSAFAPRAPDDVVGIGGLCQRLGVPHVVNNAFGVQSSKTTHVLSEAIRTGRVDAIVQSTDKNFMVPVGGAVIASPSREFVDAVSRSYPGRASMSPVLDLFMTLLSMGRDQYKHLLAERKELFAYFTGRMQALAEAHGERLLATPHNNISFGMTLSTFVGSGASKCSPAFVGSMLFSRGCSGTRVFTPGDERKKVCGVEFASYGAHADGYPLPYLTAACAIGVTRGDIDTFVERLDKVLHEAKPAREQAQTQQR
eukprot:m51a1_g1549 putative o-phosphoseryl-trna selenium transferase-like (648) ;mRNA; r:570341-574802